MLTGTIINALAILAGSAVGMGIHALAGRFSAVLGAKGTRLGELLDLDARMGKLGQWVQDKLSHILKSGGGSVAEGFVTAALLFCVGAMAIVGALENGLTGNFDTLKAKAVLDGVSAIVLASSLGIGVALSAGAVLIYQGIIALAASALSPLLENAVIAEMTCVGSLLIVALSQPSSCPSSSAASYEKTGHHGPLIHLCRPSADAGGRGCRSGSGRRERALLPLSPAPAGPGEHPLRHDGPAPGEGAGG